MKEYKRDTPGYILTVPERVVDTPEGIYAYEDDKFHYSEKELNDFNNIDEMEWNHNFLFVFADEGKDYIIRFYTYSTDSSCEEKSKVFFQVVHDFLSSIGKDMSNVKFDVDNLKIVCE